MEKDTYKTKVIFRYWEDEVIAIFPELPSDSTSSYPCESYMHVGQHGSCYPQGIILSSRLATEEEYKDLKEELETRGYDLVICKRISPQMRKEREKQFQLQRI